MKSLILSLSLAGLVFAHGYVQEITLGSTKYSGYLPYSDPYILSSSRIDYWSNESDT